MVHFLNNKGKPAIGALKATSQATAAPLAIKGSFLYRTQVQPLGMPLPLIALAAVDSSTIFRSIVQFIVLSNFLSFLWDLNTLSYHCVAANLALSKDVKAYKKSKAYCKSHSPASHKPLLESSENFLNQKTKCSTTSPAKMPTKNPPVNTWEIIEAG